MRQAKRAARPYAIVGTAFRKGRITANAIAPGLIDTDMAAGVPADIRSKIPAESVGSPDEVARIVVLLAETKTINGQTYNINAGRYMS